MQDENKLYSEEVEQNILGCMLVFKECVRYIKEIDKDENIKCWQVCNPFDGKDADRN